jgi:hypothetical protein
MASIRKSFNFRNGIQVDNDNFIINANGLVGIGTSVPSEVLDVIGTLKVSDNIITDDINATDINVSGISTFSRLITNNYINVGVTSITSGIITSYTGVVTYYGDGGRLLNLPTSQWLDVDVGLGFTSIYAQGFVGIATNDPRYVFQIGGRYSNLADLSTLIRGVGISSNGNIRATGIVTAGYFYGDGASITGINASNITLGTLPNSRLANTVIVNNIDASGIITSATYFDGSLVGIASTARDITLESSLEITGLTVGVSTVNTVLHVGDSVGIGTNITNSDLYIKKSGISSIKLLSDLESIIRIGRGEFNVDENGEIRFGNTSSDYEYSTTQSFDIINYDSGNLNYYNNVSGGFGDFNWIRGLGINLMTLTSGGKLGIGITDPTYDLEVVGTGKVTSDFYIGGNLTAIGNATLSGVFEVTDQINVTGTAFFNNIGVATDSSSYDFQVGANPQLPNGGVGISSSGYVRIKNDIPIVRHINSSGIVTATSLVSSGTIQASSTITGNSFSGNGASLTSLNASNISSGTLNNARLPSAISITGNLTAATITGTTFSGNGASLTSLNASNISSGTLSNSRLPSDISITGALSAGSASITGALSADTVTASTSFSGNGSLLTNLNASNISSGTLSNSRLPSAISITGNLSASAITGATFSGDGALLTNLNASNISSGTLSNSRLPSNYNGNSILNLELITTSSAEIQDGLFVSAGISTFSGEISCNSDITADRFFNSSGEYISWEIDQVADTITFFVGVPGSGYTGSVTLNLV